MDRLAGRKLKLFAACARALSSVCIDEKTRLIDELLMAAQSGVLEHDAAAPVAPIAPPGYPRGLLLVAPQRVPKRNTSSAQGRVVLIHAIAHIEYVAIHLALDACYRFRALPGQYYSDWLRVAAEEARHFQLLGAYLAARNCAYGTYSAHNGLWDMASKTSADPLERMAMVPLVMEARGLDVTPGLRARFAAAGDREAVAALDVILRDEIGHVAIGRRWYRHLCTERGLDPVPTFFALSRRHHAPRPHLPLNREARLRAGFSEAELAALAADCRRVET